MVQLPCVSFESNAHEAKKKDEKKELRFRIFSIDMGGMSSTSSRTFQHFIEEPPSSKGEHYNDTRNVRPVMPLRRRNGRGTRSGNQNQIPLRRRSPEKVYQKSTEKHVV